MKKLIQNIIDFISMIIITNIAIFFLILNFISVPLSSLSIIFLFGMHWFWATFLMTIFSRFSITLLITYGFSCHGIYVLLSYPEYTKEIFKW